MSVIRSEEISIFHLTDLWHSRHTDKGWFSVSSLSSRVRGMLPGTSSSPTVVGTCFYLLPVYSRVTCIASLINVLSFQIDSPKLGIKLLLQAQGHKEQETNFVLSLMFPLIFNCEVVTSSLRFVDCSVPGSSVLHYLPEFAQIHVHWGGDAI